MRTLVLAVTLLACAPSPVSLQGIAPGVSATTAPEPKKPKAPAPAPIVPLSGKATATGGMR